ncbi:beta-N-acetylhexosaminidase [Arcticibacter sp.]|uniref:beta-N-acetylhexosaminidase n=1 Tax=Arcticibacter sp. TaxID=1872630 RepID=UPI00388D72F6
MKRKLIIALLCCAFTASAQQRAREIAIIPEPVEIVRQSGTFTLPGHVSIRIGTSPGLQHVADFLKERLSVPTGSQITVSPQNPSATIYFQINKEPDTLIGDEGYRLDVGPKQIMIKANKAAGLFYASQTLIQLLPKEIESATEVRKADWQIPCMEVTDYPRFGWRGLMFDVSRHFFTKEEVKRYIDNMVRYKYNLLHLHLSDDEGWRIQIKSLPKLTEVGAWSVKKVGYFGKFSPPTADEPRNYGGFYTQEDIRELVEYAKARFVDIMPEIDVPGHSLAAIASYPELSCTPEAKNYVVRSGEQIMDWSRGAPPIALVDNALCPANEKVYEFVDKVVTELAELFPFEYIHMGGDEAAHNFWAKNPQVKALMLRENLKTMEQVQGYFTKRVEKIVASKGKKFIGWDEIVAGGVPSSAAVMSWRGVKNGIDAAKAGHEVVMTPMQNAYIDLMQGDPAIEPRNYASVRLSQSYQMEVLPDGVDPKLIKGGQGNLWTEQIYNMRQAEYMTWPRGWAISEALWSPTKKRNWNDFIGRVEKQFERMDIAEVKYAPSMYDPIVSVSRDKNRQLVVSLTPEIEGLDIYTSFDNSFPDHFYPKYVAPLVVPKDASNMRVITYRGKKPVGRMVTITVSDLESRVKK